ncbi:hypothetical protein Mmc1_3066 [Magnetococcus marinus MC-1]|uniref:Uncharacterized protein n=1 Tax=Magnetococcus marinus (strain ATCC BAA-1437 / JCM 17883 / MC-1) TaxID=156889 RepID=A0LC64_MAGMM|nr:hypothetical protein [Magnetococcus marinus]ABK45557.1 hypothetical protein Mmc1_3066 [Magnetococcus marinus MC-1]
MDKRGPIDQILNGNSTSNPFNMGPPSPITDYVEPSPDAMAGGAIHNGRVSDYPWIGPFGLLGFPKPEQPMGTTHKQIITKAKSARRRASENMEPMTLVRNHEVDQIL